MWMVISRILIGVGAFALICGLLAVIAACGYRRLTVNLRSIRFVPQFQFNAGSIAGVVINAALRNFIPAAGSLVKGIKLAGSVTLENRSPIPLFIPNTRYSVIVEGRQVNNSIALDSFWLKPGTIKTMPVALNLNKEDISNFFITGITGRGRVAVEINLSVCLGHFSYSKNKMLQISIPNSIRDALRHRGT